LRKEWFDCANRLLFTFTKSNLWMQSHDAGDAIF
jgi:hypothetical protein